MMKRISLFMSCRIGGNENSNLVRCLNSFCGNGRRLDQVELLIKFDEDDPELKKALATLKPYQERLSIKTIITPRGTGYTDLHKAYDDLLLLASPDSHLYWVISDDVEMLKEGWDDYLIKTAKASKSDVCVMHPIKTLPYEEMTLEDVIDSPDPYPIWSKKWITIAGGFGHTFSTDGWSAMIERELAHRYGLNKQIMLKDFGLKRYEGEADKPGSERWNTVRKETHEKMLRPQTRTLLAQVAENIYLHHLSSKKQGLLTRMLKKHATLSA